MHVVQITNKEAFLEQARETRSRVEVVCRADVVPVTQADGRSVLMTPALKLFYAFEFNDPGMGHSRWSTVEVFLVDKEGVATVRSQLWDAISGGAAVQEGRSVFVVDGVGERVPRAVA